MRAALALAAATAAALGAPAPLVLPGADPGIGFDDLRFSAELHRVIVPAGRTGRVDLVDPATGAVTSIEGFSRSASRGRGHAEGTTSADAGGGYLFAIDRTEQVLAVIDPQARRIVARTKLTGGPDYVRWVGAAQQVWVTEPGRASIEMFRLEPGARPELTRAGELTVPGGPESLVIDDARGRAYTNTFHDATIAIDTSTHAIVARWPNRCRGARGLALDAARGLLFVGCDEGKAVALDAARGGRVTGEVKTGAGVDVIDFSPSLSRLYVPGAESATLTAVDVADDGQLGAVATAATAPDAHCAVVDDRGNVYVCDPRGGRLLVFHDAHPASR